MKIVFQEYPPVELTIDAQQVADFSLALGLVPEDGVVPPTYAAVYALGATVPQLFADPQAGIDLSHLLHAEQEFVWERHPQVGERVVAQGRVVSNIERRGMCFVSFETNCSVEGASFCRSRALFVITSSSTPPRREEKRTSDRNPPPTPPRKGEGICGGGDLMVTFTKEQIKAYAHASGDHNPIHLDEEFARSVGLPGVIAHGMLQMGLVARVAGPPQQLKQLSCRFSGLVQPGDTVTYQAYPLPSPSPTHPFRAGSAGTPGGGGRVELSAHNQFGEAVLSKARAELLPNRD